MQQRTEVFWLIYSEDDAVKNKTYISFYEKEGEKLGLIMQLLIAEKLSFGVKENVLYLSCSEEELRPPKFVIVRTIYPFLSRHLEMMGYSVWNNAFIAEMCNDKAKTYQYLAGTGIQMPDTSFIKFSLADQVLERTEIKNSDYVIKAVDGHGGTSVFLYNNDRKADLIRSMKSSDMVLQPRIGTKNKDVRVYVIGNKIIAAILRIGKNDFRSNFSLGGEVCLYDLKQQEKFLVEKIITKFDFGLVGIDFIIDDNDDLIFNEIEDVVGARMLYQCTDINLVRLYLEYIMNKEGAL